MTSMHARELYMGQAKFLRLQHVLSVKRFLNVHGEIHGRGSHRSNQPVCIQFSFINQSITNTVSKLEQNIFYRWRRKIQLRRR